jgi:hypothetical protein
VAKANYSSGPQANVGFGQSSFDEWGIYGSYEYLDNDFSFRVNSAYSKYNDLTEDVTEFNWNGSYAAFNAGKALISVGYLERWWGPSWQHNVSLATLGHTAPSASLSYMGDKLPVIGYWSAESVYSYLDTSFDYLWSSKLSIKPRNWLELGLNYHLSAESDDFIQLNDVGGDIRASLPSLFSENKLTHGLFASFTQSSITDNLNSSESLSGAVYGWDAHIEQWETSFRLVIEGQSASDVDSNRLSQQSYHQLLDINTLLWGDSHSIALYTQFKNDHKLAVVYRDTRAPVLESTIIQADYQIPYLAGQFYLGLGVSEKNGQFENVNEGNASFGYEVRY